MKTVRIASRAAEALAALGYQKVDTQVQFSQQNVNKENAMWYINHCKADGMETWDVHFGELGSGFETIECQTEKNALEVVEVLNRVKAGPDTNAGIRQPWQDTMLTARGPSNQENDEEGEEEESLHP